MLHPVPEPVQQTLLNGEGPLRRLGGSRESHSEADDQDEGEGETTIRIAGHGNPPLRGFAGAPMAPCPRKCSGFRSSGCAIEKLWSGLQGSSSQTKKQIIHRKNSMARSSIW